MLIHVITNVKNGVGVLFFKHPSIARKPTRNPLFVRKKNYTLGGVNFFTSKRHKKPVLIKRLFMEEINKIKSRIRKALKEQGSYSKDMESIIELTAGNFVAYYLALRDVEGLTESYVVEVTREGNEKLSPHPAIKTLRETTEIIRRCLRELRLTVATVDPDNDDYDDGINDLTNAVESVV